MVRRAAIRLPLSRVAVCQVIRPPDIDMSQDLNTVHMCERELDALDLTINVKKSCCLRIGSRNNVIMSASVFSVWYISAMGDRD